MQETKAKVKAKANIHLGHKKAEERAKARDIRLEAKAKDFTALISCGMHPRIKMNGDHGIVTKITGMIGQVEPED